MSSTTSTTTQNSAENGEGSATDQRLTEFEDKMRKLFPKKNYIISRRDPYCSESRFHCIMQNKDDEEYDANVLLVVWHEVDIELYRHLFDYYGGGFKGAALNLFDEYKDVLGTVPYENLDATAVLVYKRQPVEKSQNKKETEFKLVKTSAKGTTATKRKMNANETDARKKARVESKIRLNDDSQQKNGKPKFKAEYSFKYDYLKKNFDYQTNVAWGCGKSGWTTKPIRPRDRLYYDDPDADHPQIDWDRKEPKSMELIIKKAKQTILNHILKHLVEDKSLAIDAESNDWEIPLTMHDFNAGLMSAKQIYENVWGVRCPTHKSLVIVKCIAEPFLGCYIICDGRRSGGHLLGKSGQKLNKMASHFLKNQVASGKIYGKVILTRRVTERIYPSANTNMVSVPVMPEWMKDFVKKYDY